MATNPDSRVRGDLDPASESQEHGGPSGQSEAAEWEVLEALTAYREAPVALGDDAQAEAVLGAWVNVLGAVSIAEILAADGADLADVPDDSEGARLSEEDRVYHYVYRICPQPREVLEALARALGSRVLPAAAGIGRIELRRPSSVYATRLGESGVVRWHPARFPAGSAKLSLYSLAGDDVPADAVTLAEDGRICVRAEAIPADGRWFLYCLSERPLAETVRAQREVFVIQRNPTRGDKPAELVLAGRLAEAWQAALDQKWSDDQLTCLLLLLIPRMSQLLEEARAALDLPGVEYLLADLDEIPGQNLEQVQQALIESLPISLEGDYLEES